MAGEQDKREEEDEENTFNILVATDCHIGYMEKDSERSDDSLNSFEEILQHAKKLKVDMVLLGGDLFHENKPSRKSLHGCMALIRKYCMGDRPVQIEFLSDQSVNFSSNPFPVVNYEDPNMNIEIPIFSIHGNHDDPAGLANLCTLDILSVAGLINYFGKSSSLENVEISPVLLQKGKTKLALYGLGAIRDERLHRMFVQGKISTLRPKKDRDSWFNIFVIHQNRVKHGEHNYIPEQFLSDFIDLVLWGHEHECLVEPVWNATQNFFISQPGSSIATSLGHGEAVKKHVALLQVRGKAMKCTKVPLDTVRPFYIEDLALLDSDLDPDDVNCEKKMEEFCAAKIEQFIEKAADEHTGNPKQPKLPLIRLRVDYSGGFSTFNINRFGQRFINKVANTKDLLLFHKRREMKNKTETKPGDDLANLLTPEALSSQRVEDLVKQYFSTTDEAKQLHLLSEKGLGQAIREFVEKKENDAIIELVNFQLGKIQKHLKQRHTKEEQIGDELTKFKEERFKMSEAEVDKEVKEVMETAKKKRQDRGDSVDNSEDGGSADSSDDTGSSKPTKSSRGKEAGRGRGRGRGRGTSTSKGRQTAVVVIDDEDDDAGGSGSAQSSRRGRGSRGGRGTRGCQTSTKQTTLSSTSFFSSSKSKKGPIQFDDDDDDPEPPSSKKRKDLIVNISESDDDDPFSIPPPSNSKRSRRH